MTVHAHQRNQTTEYPDAGMSGGNTINDSANDLRKKGSRRLTLGRDANVFVEGLRFEPEPLMSDRLDVLTAPN
jgi:hypothetical protein